MRWVRAALAAREREPRVGAGAGVTAPAVVLSRVTKSFGSHTAVDEMTLEIPEGRIFGLLGPNGAGKTTTLRMMMGILLPDRGRVRIFGEEPDDVRRARVGYLPEERGLYRRMRTLDLLVYLAELRGLARSEARRRAGRWLERLELSAWADARIEDLSKGMQQKVQFVATVLHDPALLVLDEPFTGLDPINQDVLESLVREARDGGATVIFSTHRMAQAERMCERVCLMAEARVVLEGDLRELKRRERRGVVAVAFDGPARWLDRPEVVGREPGSDGLHLVLAEEADPQRLLRAAVEAGATVRRFELLEPTLHEIFVRHAGPAVAPGAAGYPEGAGPAGRSVPGSGAGEGP